MTFHTAGLYPSPSAALWQVWQTVSVAPHDCGETTWCRNARALSFAPQSPHWALSMDRTAPA